MPTHHKSLFTDAEMYYVPRYLSKGEADALEREVNDDAKFRRQTLYFNDREKLARLNRYQRGENPTGLENTHRLLNIRIVAFPQISPITTISPLVQGLKERLERGVRCVLQFLPCR